MPADLRPDIAAARSRMRSRTGGAREIRRLELHVPSPERVEAMVVGMLAGGQGLLVLTDRRVLFVDDRRRSQHTKEFSLAEIQSIAWVSDVLTGRAVIAGPTGQVQVKNVNKDGGKEFVELVRSRLPEDLNPGRGSGDSPDANPQSQADESRILENLRKLGELRDAGVLTDEEFVVKKRDLLDRL
jgi:hypothetical protein